MHAITSAAGHAIGNEFKISTVAKLSTWRMIAMIVGSAHDRHHGEQQHPEPYAVGDGRAHRS